eukprot:TRINITY_DN2919_c0_g2_i1.p1 TRINITY_DN2919_c0_g2~~TRINITY_DN2919_c0_g2_i1.p1  ORF type:complete len:400 (+),score=155.35 TRINITY_DN2919_c0_g2_i1:879-2078(+)
MKNESFLIIFRAFQIFIQWNYIEAVFTAENKELVTLVVSNLLKLMNECPRFKVTHRITSSQQASVCHILQTKLKDDLKSDFAKFLDNFYHLKDYHEKENEARFQRKQKEKTNENQRDREKEKKEKEEREKKESERIRKEKEKERIREKEAKKEAKRIEREKELQRQQANQREKEKEAQLERERLQKQVDEAPSTPEGSDLPPPLISSKIAKKINKSLSLSSFPPNSSSDSDVDNSYDPPSFEHEDSKAEVESGEEKFQSITKSQEEVELERKRKLDVLNNVRERVNEAENALFQGQSALLQLESEERMTREQLEESQSKRRLLENHLTSLQAKFAKENEAKEKGETSKRLMELENLHSKKHAEMSKIRQSLEMNKIQLLELQISWRVSSSAKKESMSTP